MVFVTRVGAFLSAPRPPAETAVAARSLRSRGKPPTEKADEQTRVAPSPILIRYIYNTCNR
eukprot:scaffold39950_cov32-Tisochrysis_lutea.AAC.1